MDGANAVYVATGSGQTIWTIIMHKILVIDVLKR